jgi:hypothetical protein
VVARGSAAAGAGGRAKHGSGAGAARRAGRTTLAWGLQMERWQEAETVVASLGQLTRPIAYVDAAAVRRGLKKVFVKHASSTSVIMIPAASS